MDKKKFREFRERVYQSFPARADALMDLVDALASNTYARSPVELSLSPLFRRQYSSIGDAITNFFVPNHVNPHESESEQNAQQKELMRVMGGQYPEPVLRNFYHFGLDTTTNPRQFAQTLNDRGFQYEPNPIIGNKPITIGHSYSVLAGLPEKESGSPPWVLPLLAQRVKSKDNAADIGIAQIAAVLTDEELPFGKNLSVTSADSRYGGVRFVGPAVTKYQNLVLVTRSRGNRVYNHKPPLEESSETKPGHPTWYGDAFDLKASSTWGKPDLRHEESLVLKSGRKCRVKMDAWKNVLMRGTRDIPMHKKPFTLVRVRLFEEHGERVFKKDLWLSVHGKRRHELSLHDIYDAYRQRYDLEHFFRFGKQKLLMTSYQTPEVQHEENWWSVVLLAYAHLFLSAPMAHALPRPWERYLPSFKANNENKLASPAMAQRDYYRIIQEIGTPAAFPKPRGKSPGRAKGMSPGRRNRPPVIKKGGKKKNRSP